jgi:phosphoribosyl-ATP pyrophosphohydrolase/phosphoribosyl-AMP cyclohydrolase
MNIFQQVYETIADRDKNPQEGSYTTMLLQKGIDKIAKKFGEEAVETVIAAKNDNKQELVGELADLEYHLLVLMYKKGITIQDLVTELENRFGKGGFHGRTDKSK